MSNNVKQCQTSCQTVAEQVYHTILSSVNGSYIVNQCQTSCQTVAEHYWYIILFCKLIYIVKQCQTVSDKLSNSCRTNYYHTILSSVNG